MFHNSIVFFPAFSYSVAKKMKWSEKTKSTKDLNSTFSGRLTEIKRQFRKGSLKDVKLKPATTDGSA